MIDERDFLTAILQHPDDDVTKLVYADWLEEHGDPRGEYLRLMVKVRQKRKITPEQRQRRDDLAEEMLRIRTEQSQLWHEGKTGGSRARQAELMQRSQRVEDELSLLSQEMRAPIPAHLQEFAATIDPQWLAAVSAPEIEGCGKLTQGWALRFKFVCDRTWADLQPTDSDTVRHCDSCSENVHFCDNLADARAHSYQGHCIAVDLGIRRREGDLEPRTFYLGQPSAESMRKSYEEDIDPVSRARLNARKGKKKRRR